MKDVGDSQFNTLQATQHTMLKKRPQIENLQKSLCDFGDKNAIGQRKFEYNRCFEELF